METDTSEAREKARNELQGRGIRFDESWFLKAVRAGDLALVKLFLAAGISPVAEAPSGDSAVTEAARQGHAEVAKALLKAGADPDDLVAAAKRGRSRKERWEKLTSAGVLALLSSLTIALAGWIVTSKYNDRQLEIATIQTVEKFIPHLISEGDGPRRTSLLVLKALGKSNLWAQLAEATGGPGAIEALQKGAQGPNGQKDPAAVQTLSNIASRTDDADATRAKKALTDVFAIEKSAMVMVTSGNAVCPGFSLKAKENLIATAGCVRTNAPVKVETSNHMKVSAMPTSVHPDTGLALLKTSTQLPKQLLLAEKEPSIGSLVVGLVFDQEGNVQALPGRVDDVDAAVNINGNGRNIKGENWLRLTVEAGSLPSVVGAPILDETGKVICIVVAALNPHTFCAPLEQL
jgi:hypothetical protein